MVGSTLWKAFDKCQTSLWSIAEVNGQSRSSRAGGDRISIFAASCEVYKSSKQKESMAALSSAKLALQGVLTKAKVWMFPSAESSCNCSEFCVGLWDKPQWRGAADCDGLGERNATFITGITKLILTHLEKGGATCRAIVINQQVLTSTLTPLYYYDEVEKEQTAVWWCLGVWRGCQCCDLRHSRLPATEKGQGRSPGRDQVYEVHLCGFVNISGLLVGWARYR